MRSKTDVEYMFRIVPEKAIPEGSVITIDFPDCYNLWSSNPPVEIESVNLEQ